MSLMELLADPKGITEHIENVLWGLAIVVVLSMVLERALQMPFEWSPIQGLIERGKLKAPIAVIVATLMCYSAGFDLISVIAIRSTTTWHGMLMTAALIAGGSKGAILLFQGVLGFAKENVDAKIKGVPPQDDASATAAANAANAPAAATAVNATNAAAVANAATAATSASVPSMPTPTPANRPHWRGSSATSTQ
jgi:hypothetical protein